MLRTPAEFTPAPSSGENLSELASLMESRQSGSMTQSPQYQRSSKMSTDKRNSYGVSLNTAGVLSPRANPSTMRSISIDSEKALPITENGKNSINDQAPQKPRRATLMRAAEAGKGSLLPMRGNPISMPRQQQLPQRIQRKPPGRSNSSGPSNSGALPRTRQDLGDNKAHKETFLRRRNANASSDDEFDSSSQTRVRRSYSGIRRQRQNSGMSVGSTGSLGGTNNGNTSREHSSSIGWGNGILCERQLIKLSRMKLGHLLQVVIVLAVIALVYESHHKALFATQKLMQFKEEESLLLLHLHKIEEITLHLHENFERMAIASGDGSGGNAGLGSSQEDENVDLDLIHKQMDQLHRMEKDLTQEVQTLQKRIQRSARGHIIQEFGEGPVQVVLELNFGNAASNVGSNRISILLWHETPHAAWTWLEQIGNNVWDGAEFKWQEGHIIDASPPKEKVDHEREGKIEFIEHPKHDEHVPWTVGVREQPNNGGGRGAMGMYINLQDNSQLHRHETCVGKVIDGFDTLQKLLELSRNNGNGDQSDNSSSRTLPILIRKATAEHYVTKKAGM